MVGVGVPLALQVKVTLPWRPWLMIITMLRGGISTVGLSVYREIWNGEILLMLQHLHYSAKCRGNVVMHSMVVGYHKS